MYQERVKRYKERRNVKGKGTREGRTGKFVLEMKRKYGELN